MEGTSGALARRRGEISRVSSGGAREGWGGEVVALTLMLALGLVLASRISASSSASRSDAVKLRPRARREGRREPIERTLLFRRIGGGRSAEGEGMRGMPPRGRPNETGGVERVKEEEEPMGAPMDAARTTSGGSRAEFWSAVESLNVNLGLNEVSLPQDTTKTLVWRRFITCVVQKVHAVDAPHARAREAFLAGEFAVCALSA
jgi:hypothetical protein